MSEFTPAVEDLRATVVEVERYVGRSGWDRSPRLFALAGSAELAATEPRTAAALRMHADHTGALTPVEQDIAHEAGGFEELLQRIEFPPQVHGAVAVLERVTLPADAESQAPDDPAYAPEFALEHPQRQDVRVAVGVLRSGVAHCVVRVRSHDDDAAVLQGPDMAPGLVALLHETLEPGGATTDEGVR